MANKMYGAQKKKLKSQGPGSPQGYGTQRHQPGKTYSLVEKRNFIADAIHNKQRHQSGKTYSLVEMKLQLSEDIESSQNKKRTTWHVETPSVSMPRVDGNINISGLQ